MLKPEIPSAASSEIKPRSLDELKQTAVKIRRNIITMIGKAASGHPGGSLSAVEILSSLYFRELHVRPTAPNWPDRDRFILSKGHAAPALYSILAEAGFFPEKELLTLRQIDSRLQGHADRTSTPGVENSSGSLGQGLSFGIGAALAGKMDSKAWRVYVLMGDGEQDEGQVWEAAMAAAHYRLDNMVAIIDNNGLQIDGCNCDVMGIDPLDKKWEAFGWNVISVDGHNFEQILAALAAAKTVKGKPTMIIAHTVKGKGVSFMENNVDYHGKPPSPAQVEQALKELV